MVSDFRPQWRWWMKTWLKWYWNVKWIQCKTGLLRGKRWNLLPQPATVHNNRVSHRLKTLEWGLMPNHKQAALMAKDWLAEVGFKPIPPQRLHLNSRHLATLAHVLRRISSLAMGVVTSAAKSQGMRIKLVCFWDECMRESRVMVLLISKNAAPLICSGIQLVSRLHEVTGASVKWTTAVK